MMNSDPTPYPLEEQRTRNRLIGLAAVIVIVALFLVGWHLQKKRSEREAHMLQQANASLAAGIAGHCEAFAQARDLYMQAMKFHLQSKDLAGKAKVADQLVELCGQNLTPLIETRKTILREVGAQPTDIKALALAQLADGNKAGALATLALLPNDPFGLWLRQWLVSLPPVPPQPNGE